MVFDFYSAFLPGLMVYEGGYVKTSDLTNFGYKTFAEKAERLNCKSGNCQTCNFGMQQITTKGDADGLVDFYGMLYNYNGMLCTECYVRNVMYGIIINYNGD